MKNIPTRWYRRADGSSTRRAVDIHGHAIFMNARIGRARRAVVEAWEVRFDGRELGIVWATWGQIYSRWHFAEPNMKLSRKPFWQRDHAIDALIARYMLRQMKRENPRTRPAPELDDFRI